MSSLASRTAGLIITRVGRFLEDSGVGGGIFPEQTFQCFPHDSDLVRRPDVAYITAERLAGVDQEGHITIAPDIAVEVTSPSDKIYKFDEKLADYRSAGIKLVWEVNPKFRYLRIHRLGGARSSRRNPNANRRRRFAGLLGCHQGFLSGGFNGKRIAGDKNPIPHNSNKSNRRNVIATRWNSEDKTIHEDALPSSASPIAFAVLAPFSGTPTVGPASRAGLVIHGHCAIRQSPARLAGPTEERTEILNAERLGIPTVQRRERIENPAPAVTCLEIRRTS